LISEGCVPVKPPAPPQRRTGNMDYSISKDVDADMPTRIKWSKQREKRGFDDTELWNLDVTISKFLVPRL